MSSSRFFPVAGDILLSSGIVTKINTCAGNTHAFEIRNREIFIVINVFMSYSFLSDQPWKRLSDLPAVWKCLQAVSADRKKEFLVFPSEIPHIFNIARCENSP